ncbi:MAG: acyl CoA:acetate/3-ketoacid CoA transferase [Fusobacteriaceae bacterium]
MKLQKKLMTAQQAANLINSEDTVAINGFGSLLYPEEVTKALGERFLETGAPKNLSYIFGPGLGEATEGRLVDGISHEGMVKKVVASHFIKMIGIKKLAQENKIEAYNLPFGAISHMFRAAAGKKPGIVTKIGLKTFVDPRNTRGALNEMSKDTLAELMVIDGEEYLFYKSPKPNISIIRGTTADKNGNITFEKEAFYIDPFTTAMAAKANGGKVIVQVERISGEKANPRDVKIPGIIVDAIVVAPNQWQTMIEQYNPSYTGALVVPESEIPKMLDKITKLSIGGGKKERTLVHKIIARRAAMELKENAVVNLGIGIPELVPSAAKELGIETEMDLTIEAGLIGGTPSGGLSFGAVINPEMCQDSAYQFDLYDGGTLDITFVGAMQIDEQGNVNVSKSGGNIIGVGGFVNLTQSAKKCVFCFPFSGGGNIIEFSNKKLEIVKEGKYQKFVKKVDEISASGEFAMDTNQEILYVTERCVFQLTKKGLEIIEIAPGLDLEKDIMALMPFRPLVSENIKEMDQRLFS